MQWPASASVSQAGALYPLSSITSPTHFSSTQTMGSQNDIASIMVIPWVSVVEAVRKHLARVKMSEFKSSSCGIFPRKTILSRIPSLAANSSRFDLSGPSPTMTKRTSGIFLETTYIVSMQTSKLFSRESLPIEKIIFFDAVFSGIFENTHFSSVGSGFGRMETFAAGIP